MENRTEAQRGIERAEQIVKLYDDTDRAAILTDAFTDLIMWAAWNDADWERAFGTATRVYVSAELLEGIERSREILDQISKNLGKNAT
ncbi:hypothetical protein [Streptomyces formicae]